MHHRDLAGRAAEGQQRDAQPDADGLGEADAVGGPGDAAGEAELGHGAPRLLGQLWVSPVASRHQR